MIRIQFYTLSCILLLAGSTASIQAQEIPTEQILLHTDRELYLTGETIWLSAHSQVSNWPANTPFSQVLYVEIINHQQQSIVRAKFSIVSGQASGQLIIPASIPSAVYFLSAYTSYMRNGPPEIRPTLPIRIVNPTGGSVMATSDSSISLLPVSVNGEIRIQLDKQQYLPRSPIDLAISLANGASIPTADVSISIIKQGTEPRGEPGFSPIHKPAPPLEWMPEIRGLSLSGKIQATDQSVTSTPVWLTVLGNYRQLHPRMSQANGDFLFALDPLVGTHPIAVIADPSEQAELDIRLRQDFSREYPTMPRLSLGLDSSHQELLTELWTHAQVTQRYPKFSQAAPPATSSVSFAWEKPFITQLLEDFIEIPTLEEVIEEIIPAVSVRRNKEGTALLVFDDQRLMSYENPLILLDNLPIFDVEALLKIKPNEVAQINVYNRRYLWGETWVEGIVQIETKAGDYGGMSLPDNTVFLRYEGFSAALPFPAPDYSVANSSAAYLPDFRNTLYWNPTVRLTPQAIHLPVFTSDHASTYVVLVRGVTEEGKVCSGSATFEVVRPEK